MWNSRLSHEVCQGLLTTSPISFLVVSDVVNLLVNKDLNYNVPAEISFVKKSQSSASLGLLTQPVALILRIWKRKELSARGKSVPAFSFSLYL
jgi:hypothetical protein